MNRVRSALLRYRIVSARLSSVCSCVVSCSHRHGLTECWLERQESDLLDKLIQLWSWWTPSICIFKILKQFIVPLCPFRGSQTSWASGCSGWTTSRHLPLPRRHTPRFTATSLQILLSLPCCLYCFFLLFPSSLPPSSDFIHRRGKVYLNLFV